MNLRPAAVRILALLNRRGVACLLGLCVLLSAAAAAGRVSLLTSFGHHGILRLAPGRISGLATEKDGHLVAVGFSGGSMLVERLTATGTHPRRFAAGPGVANAVLVQPDGKIVVAGTQRASASASFNGDMVLKRFNANGSPDRGFGSHGVAHAPGAVANGVALGPKGTIVIAGYMRGPDATPRVAIARFRSNGQPDPSFGTHGFAEVDLGPYSEANGMAVQRDGKIVFAGDQSPDLQIVNALIGRVSKNGKLDRGFGTAGVYFYYHPHGGAASSFRAVTIDGSGRVIGVGIDVETAPYALFARLRPNGKPDGGFGSGGVLTAPSAIHTLDNLVGASAVAISRHGEIVASGQYVDSALNFAALWAISPRGRLDSAVKTLLPTPLGGAADSVALTPGGDTYFGGALLLAGGKTQSFIGRYRGP